MPPEDEDMPDAFDDHPPINCPEDLSVGLFLFNMAGGSDDLDA